MACYDERSLELRVANDGTREHRTNRLRGRGPRAASSPACLTPRNLKEFQRPCQAEVKFQTCPTEHRACFDKGHERASITMLFVLKLFYYPCVTQKHAR